MIKKPNFIRIEQHQIRPRYEATKYLTVEEKTWDRFDDRNQAAIYKLYRLLYSTCASTN